MFLRKNHQRSMHSASAMTKTNAISGIRPPDRMLISMMKSRMDLLAMVRPPQSGKGVS